MDYGGNVNARIREAARGREPPVKELAVGESSNSSVSSRGPKIGNLSSNAVEGVRYLGLESGAKSASTRSCKVHKRVVALLAASLLDHLLLLSTLFIAEG